MMMTSFKIWVLITSKLRRLYPIFGVKRLDPYEILISEMSLILKIDQYLTEIWPSQCWVPYFKINILTLSSLVFKKGRKVGGGDQFKSCLRGNV